MIVNVEQIDPFSLPSVAIRDRKSLPETRAIYFVVSVMELLYIGRATNLQNRWTQHHRIKDFNLSAHIAWLSLPDMIDEELKKLEETCIRHFEPQMNQVVIPERSIPLNKEATSFRLSKETKELIKRQSAWWGISEASYLTMLISQKALELGLIQKP